MANRRGKVEGVTDFIFLSSKITVDGDCSHEIKRHLLLAREVMTNLDSILKRGDIHYQRNANLQEVNLAPSRQRESFLVLRIKAVPSTEGHPDHQENLP